MYQEYLMHYGVPGMKWGVRKQNKLGKRIAKINKREDKFEQKVMAKRAKNREKVMARLSVEGEGSSERKKAFEREFDSATKAIHDAVSAGKNALTKYLSMKSQSYDDKTIRKSAEYKAAKKAFQQETFMRSMYGTPYVTLNRASQNMAAANRNKG